MTVLTIASIHAGSCAKNDDFPMYAIKMRCFAPSASAGDIGRRYWPAILAGDSGWKKVNVIGTSRWSFAITNGLLAPVKVAPRMRGDIELSHDSKQSQQRMHPDTSPCFSRDFDSILSRSPGTV